MVIKVKKLQKEAQVPTQGTAFAAGYDLATVEKIEIKPGEVAFIGTGIAIEIPTGHFAMLAPRSSLCLKRHLAMTNSIGIIDADYRGEVIVSYRNVGNESVTIEAGERCAQLIILQHATLEFEEVDELSETDRGAGGFGSTGK